MKDLPKTWVSPKIHLKISEKEIQKNTTLDLYETTQWNIRALNGTVKLRLFNQN